MLKKLRNAIAERDEQTVAFQKFSDVLPKAATTLWIKAVEAWEKDPQQPNPFYIEQECTLHILIQFYY